MIVIATAAISAVIALLSWLALGVTSEADALVFASLLTAPFFYLAGFPSEISFQWINKNKSAPFKSFRLILLSALFSGLLFSIVSIFFADFYIHYFKLTTDVDLIYSCSLYFALAGFFLPMQQVASSYLFLNNHATLQIKTVFFTNIAYALSILFLIYFKMTSALSFSIATSIINAIGSALQIIFAFYFALRSDRPNQTNLSTTCDIETEKFSKMLFKAFKLRIAHSIHFFSTSFILAKALGSLPTGSAASFNYAKRTLEISLQSSSTKTIPLLMADATKFLEAENYVNFLSLASKSIQKLKLNYIALAIISAPLLLIAFEIHGQRSNVGLDILAFMLPLMLWQLTINLESKWVIPIQFSQSSKPFFYTNALFFSLFYYTTSLATIFDSQFIYLGLLCQVSSYFIYKKIALTNHLGPQS